MAEKKNRFVAIIVAKDGRQSGNKIPPWATARRPYAGTDGDKMREQLSRQPDFTCDAVKYVDNADDLDVYLKSLASERDDYADLVVFISCYSMSLGKGNTPDLIHCRDKHYRLRENIHKYFEDVQKPGIINKNKWFFIQGCCPPTYGNQGADGPGEDSPKLPAQANISIYWCEVPGDTGGYGCSPSVHHFCEVVNQLGEPTNLHLIFPDVNSRLSRDLEAAKMPIVLPETKTTGTGSIVMKPTSQQ